MPHPTEGALRRLLDEPSAVADADRRHVEGCAHCRDGLDVARTDAALVGQALSADLPPVDVDAAWLRLSAATSGPAAPVRRPGRLRKALSRPAVAAVAVGVVLAGAGTAAANDWLQVFRAEQVVPVRFNPPDLVALPDLSAYGELRLLQAPDVHPVPDAAAAAAETGLQVPQVRDLPAGVTGLPELQVGRQVRATFTFSAERAARAAAEHGEALPPVPAGLDGSTVRLEAGPGVAQVWESASGVPALFVGRAVAPAAYTDGVRFAVLRDYLLDLPGLPADVAAQLRTFPADGATLPLPVPSDEITSTTADVGGARATVLEARDRSLAAVVWVQDGLVTAVAGSLDRDEVLDVARGLR